MAIQKTTADKNRDSTKIYIGSNTFQNPSKLVLQTRISQLTMYPETKPQNNSLPMTISARTTLDELLLL